MASAPKPSLDKSQDTLSVAVCQLTSLDSFELSFRQVQACLKNLEDGGLLPDLVCFPENALYNRIQEGESISHVDLEDASVQALANWAAQTGSHLHIGSVALSESGRSYNASLLIAPNGSVRPVYRKIHLFDVDVEGQKPMRESDVYAHGPDEAVIEIKGWKLGQSICYDLRFSELYVKYAKAGVDALLIPSAFLQRTGEAHWDSLVRARAIESQCYVIAAAQGGLHRGIRGGERTTFGHSLVVDPWGVKLAEVGGDQTGPQVIRATLSKERISWVRKQIPMASHRRL